MAEQVEQTTIESLASDTPAAEAPAVEEAPAEEPVVEEAPAAEEKSAEEAPAAEADDLTKIEGIGRKIAETLTNNGIGTYAALAAADFDKVKGILTDNSLGSHDPTTWGKQAGMASNGEWDALKKWQDELDGGKVVAASSEEE